MKIAYPILLYWKYITSLQYYNIIESLEENIIKKIKQHRNRKGWSQEDFAKKSGVKYTTLTKIESGVIKKPSVMVVAQIGKTIGVSIESLLD